MFTYMPKIHFNTHFFLEILHFKKSYNLIGWQHFGPYFKNQNFARYGIGGDISIKILVFILDHFKEKLSTKFFKKSKKTYFGAIFLEKRALSFFKFSNYLPSRKTFDKTNEPFLRKMPNWRREGQTDRQMVIL